MIDSKDGCNIYDNHVEHGDRTAFSLPGRSQTAGELVFWFDRWGDVPASI